MKKTLYKTDSKGKIRVLTISVEGNIVSQVSGIQGGAMVEHTYEAKPKNIGRANETTAEEQALFEAQAKITQKLRESYSESVEAAKKDDTILPMLAKVFEDEQHKIDWSTAYVQPKLDGMRCLDTPNGKISRTNKPILTMDHIVVAGTKVDCDGSNVGIVVEDTIVDGELYAHGLNFQENMRIIKKWRPGVTEQVKFHVYDVVSDKPFYDRIKEAEDIVNNSVNCELVPTYKVESDEEMKHYHKLFLLLGYEGTMIRWGTEGYQVNGRSSNLLKYKQFQDIAAEIVDIVPSDKNPEHGTVCCVWNDIPFKCGMKASHSEREEYLNNKHEYIGKKAEIRFFEYSEDGVPRFPVFCGIREDK